jgi:hypothetical protein
MFALRRGLGPGKLNGMICGPGMRFTDVPAASTTEGRNGWKGLSNMSVTRKSDLATMMALCPNPRGERILVF